MPNDRQPADDAPRGRFPASASEEATRVERREQVAAANALSWFLSPRSVAVIGASRQRGTVGGEVLHNLTAGGFAGAVYPVNPAATTVQNLPAFPSVEAIPGEVDLAIVAVPAPLVVQVAEQCGRKGVRALVVLSAGFAEVGEQGQARQVELRRVCRAGGMRLIGPNCFGVANTDPAVRLNATFGPLPPPPGRIGFASQSGALGLAVIDFAASLGLGISSFVSMGNKADISGNDLLNYWETDPGTNLILLYLESFGNPRTFSRIARRVARGKPIVAVKSGRSVAGARAASSHTGALLASSDVTVDALFHQAGVIRTDTLEELFDVAALLASQPLPSGRRVAIVTNVGGPGILCVDTCEANGLEIPLLAPETQQRLRSFLPAEASVANPVDMIATATAEQFRQAIEAVAADPNVDAVIAIYLPPIAAQPEQVAQAIVEAAAALERRIPLLTVFMWSRVVPTILRAPGRYLPTYTFPEPAAIALAHAARYAEWRRQPPGVMPRFDAVRQEEAAAIVEAALEAGGGWLGSEAVQRLLQCYGLPVIEQRLVNSPDEAAAVAEQFGGTVALKAIAPGVLHKTDVGALRLGVHGHGAVRAEAAAMAADLRAAGYAATGFLVQRMAGHGVEMLVGVVHDRQFGPLVACGAGGVLVEVLKDLAVRLSPLTVGDAEAMVRGLRSYPLLTGFRGAPPVDVAALQDVLLRISLLADDLPRVAELDLNPVIVHEQGASIVDARIRVAPAEPEMSTLTESAAR